MLNPIFTSPYLREMTPVFHGVAYQLRDAIRTQLDGGKGTVDVVSWLGRAAMELIGRAGLGESFSALEGTEDGYVKTVKELM
jgi:hypothetical protein